MTVGLRRAATATVSSAMARIALAIGALRAFGATAVSCRELLYCTINRVDQFHKSVAGCDLGYINASYALVWVSLAERIVDPRG